MNSVDFRTREFGEGNSATAVALVAGFDGKIEHFEQTARDLVKMGNDVVAYEYDPDALLSGDPNLLLAQVDDFTRDFMARTQGYTSSRYAGVSMGAGLCWSMQRADSRALPGVYGAAGCNTAHLVMDNLVFRSLVRHFHKVDPKKEFELRGHSEADLWKAWEHLHVPPASGFAVALGGLDLVVKQREVMPKIEGWRTDADIKVHGLPRRGHPGVIKWFAKNIPFMVDLADSN